MTTPTSRVTVIGDASGPGVVTGPGSTVQPSGVFPNIEADIAALDASLAAFRTKLLGVVQLGEISGNVVINLSDGSYFYGTLVGNTDISFINGPAVPFTLDLTMGGAGGYALSFGNSGLTIVDPSQGDLIQQFIDTAPTARCIGLWSCSETDAAALGFNCDGL